MPFFKIIIIIFFAILANAAIAQDTAKQKLAAQDLFRDTSVVIKDSTAVLNSKIPKVDTTSWRFKHDPRKATMRSLILPGWGQAYNHEYWKIPLVYGAISIPVITFIFNNSWYQRTKYAYSVVIINDTNNYKNVYKDLQSIVQNDPSAATDLQYARNNFRRSRDYSILYFFLAWGLNVVDATVFGHLKAFDVSDDISLKMHVQPDYNPLSKTANLGFVFNISKPERKNISLLK